MRRTIYILIITALFLAGCKDHPSFEHACSEENYVIEIGMSNQWANLTKAVYNEPADIPAGDGLVVWSSCSVDSESVPQAIFGNGGTKVYAPDWTYSPIRFWQSGAYSFVAALPASAFNADFASSEAGKTGTANIFGNISETGALTLNFGKNADNQPLSFDLYTNQIDLMTAFPDAVTYTGGEPSAVSLSFKHLFSLLAIKVAIGSDDPDKTVAIKSITIYGIHKSASPFSISKGTNTLTGSLTNPASTPENAFAVFTRPTTNAASWDIKGTSPVQLINNLIVFPETLSQVNPLKVKVTYGEGKEFTGTLSTGEWKSGLRYTYTLSVDSIEIGEPEVTPWESGAALPEINIE